MLLLRLWVLNMKKSSSVEAFLVDDCYERKHETQEFMECYIFVYPSFIRIALIV